MPKIEPVTGVHRLCRKQGFHAVFSFEFEKPSKSAEAADPGSRTDDTRLMSAIVELGSIIPSLALIVAQQDTDDELGVEDAIASGRHWRRN